MPTRRRDPNYGAPLAYVKAEQLHKVTDLDRLLTETAMKKQKELTLAETFDQPTGGTAKFVPTELHRKAELYAERNRLYGDNYKRHGAVMKVLFPVGVNLNKPITHNRFGIFTQLVAKLTRYAAQFEMGGHDDSLDDISVYAMMLKELDHELAQQEMDEERGK